MAKKKHTTNGAVSLVYIFIGVVLILLAIVASVVIDIVTIDVCEKTLTGGCMYGDAMRSLVYTFVICGLLSIAGIISLVIGIIKRRK